jgi:hypothetical protein
VLDAAGFAPSLLIAIATATTFTTFATFATFATLRKPTREDDRRIIFDVVVRKGRATDVDRLGVRAAFSLIGIDGDARLNTAAATAPTPASFTATLA